MTEFSSSLTSMLTPSASAGPTSNAALNSPPTGSSAGGFSAALKNATSERAPVEEQAKPASSEPPASKVTEAPAPASKDEPTTAKAVTATADEEAPKEVSDSSTEGEDADSETMNAESQAESAALAESQQAKLDAIAAVLPPSSDTLAASDAVRAALSAQAAKSIADAAKADSDQEPDADAKEPDEVVPEGGVETGLNSKFASLTQAASAPQAQSQPVKGPDTPTLGVSPAAVEFGAVSRTAEMEKTVEASKARTSEEPLRAFSDLLEQSTNKVPDLPNREPSAVPVSARTPAAPGQAISIGAALHEADWGSAVAKRVTWMVGRDFQQAELRLDPPELGRINVRISVTNDQASVSFMSPHGTVREAVEASLPKLRDLLAENGFTLANVDVTSQFQQRQGEQSGRRNGSGSNGSYDSEAELDSAAPMMLRLSSDGLIDAYA